MAVGTYGPSLQDMGIGPEDWPEPEQPRCYCGAWLKWAPNEQVVVVGYPGDEFTETRYCRDCKRCGACNGAEF